ncbi:MAG: carbohydrate kinase family protein [Acidobacteria bacterium]|nr:carbohydrate kinase family protein [Acidobacteriota bacterium]MCA1637473.1 carbohydrate kinase family protein [Acidobacteriota bacterium]
MRFPFRLAENKKFDVVGFGTNAVDYLIQVPEYPSFNTKIHLSDYIQAAGGEVATTMVGLQRLGLKTAYVGRFGTDKEGDFGLQTLRDERVDVTFAEQIEDARTQIAFIVIDERNGERTVIWHRDKLLAYSEKDAPAEVVTLGKVLHFTPHDTDACLQMTRKAKENGVIVSIDIDNVFDGINELLPQVDILISSSEFPEKLVGTKDKKQSLREIKQRFGCQIVGMTLGESGSLVLCENEFIETSGFAVPNGCKDTTGAGDSFRVGFLYGLLKGETVETAARMANAVAALKCRKLGARTALPNETELFEMLQNKAF